MAPVINLGMVGHVDHGKTTLTQALSGVWTDVHSEEIKRGISIRLGYASTTMKKCPECKAPKCYTVKKKCEHCKKTCEDVLEVSFVDAPGHETLMATMLSGAAIMDGALLLIAANEPCPQPQTKEHLMALDIIGVKNIVIVQNKIDLATKEEVLENYKQIKEFVKGTTAENAPIVPLSAQHSANIDVLIKTIIDTIKVPEHDHKKPARMYIARSFDVNKPGALPEEIVGGIMGGSMVQGELGIGEEVEICPGLKKEDGNNVVWTPITTKAISLTSGNKKVKKIRPEGLVGIGTLLDPSLTKADGLSGMVLGKPGTMPPVLTKLLLQVTLMERVVGTEKELKVEDIRTNEPLMINMGTATSIGVVTSARGKEIEMNLKLPVCAEKGSRIALSRRIGNRWRLIGHGIVS